MHQLGLTKITKIKIYEIQTYTTHRNTDRKNGEIQKWGDQRETEYCKGGRFILKMTPHLTAAASCSELSPLAISPIHVCSVNKPENL